ncbi:MacS family sensor histidine kinase [Cryptosporangium sp. NPDC048952]|uniref:MacS family sensor histidine kinase n=1 Tax=Cryptosporangium sp. NPDC048952 TaxID=3363961 RepID=UPI003721F1A5
MRRNQLPPDPTAGDRRPAGFTVEVSGWRALAAFRFLTLVYAVALNLDDLGRVSSPAWCVATLAVMAAWSAVASYCYARPRLRTPVLLVVDLAVTLTTVLATLLVETPERIAGGEFTVPTVWASTAVMAWALRWEIVGGLLATLGLGVANVVVVSGQPTRGTVHNMILVLLAAIVIGYVAEVLRQVDRLMVDAWQEQGAVAERDRLARHIHDGVLQVLTLVKRRGAALDGEGRELAELAGQQESALRALMTGGSATPSDGVVDLTALVAPLAASPGIELVAPAEPVLLPADAAGELVAAVAAALHNVAEHAPGAHAWVAIEDEPDAVSVVIRDDGPGIPPERLAEAAAEGRLGVVQSIRGRIRELGGTAVITSAPDEGTEVELNVPR